MSDDYISDNVSPDPPQVRRDSAGVQPMMQKDRARQALEQKRKINLLDDGSFDNDHDIAEEEDPSMTGNSRVHTTPPLNELDRYLQDEGVP